MRENGNQRPRNWVTKAIYSVTRRWFGKVLLPVRIHGLSTRRLFGFGVMTLVDTKPRATEPLLILLGQARVASMVGCPF